MTRPRRASRKLCWEAFTRGSARRASLAGSFSPAISASIIFRPLTPIMSVITESNLMFASSSVLLDPQDVAPLLMHELLAGPEKSAHLLRRTVRHKACPDQAVREQVRDPITIFESLLRPGTFLICAALAKTSSNPPSAKMCQTGFQ